MEKSLALLILMANNFGVNFEISYICMRSSKGRF